MLGPAIRCRLYYDRTAPFTRPIKYFNTYRPAIEVAPPVAYLIPRARTEVIENLKRNGVRLRRLTAARTGPARPKLTTLPATKPLKRPVRDTTRIPAPR